MIPLHKLEKLPRDQKLRKIVKILADVENRLCPAINEQAFPAVDIKKGNTGIDAVHTNIAGIDADELVYLAAIAETLTCDPLFSPDVRALFNEAAVVFKSAAGQSGAGSAALLRRVLNNTRHLLLAGTGRNQADWDFIGGNGRLDPARRRVFPGMLVYLEDIRSPFNVGAMFRSAESFGVEKVFLSPYCADPNHARARRTAMGCVEILPWERGDFFATSMPLSAQADEAVDVISTSGALLAEMAETPVFALETGGIPLAEFPFPRQGLLIAGSEELGVSPRALAAADASMGRVSIPCYGAKGSLNVSVAFGIVMQAWALAVDHRPSPAK
jgi:TrmH family RNA methyltransferase